MQVVRTLDQVMPRSSEGDRGTLTKSFRKGFSKMKSAVTGRKSMAVGGQSPKLAALVEYSIAYDFKSFTQAASLGFEFSASLPSSAALKYTKEGYAEVKLATCSVRSSKQTTAAKRFIDDLFMCP